MDNSASIHNLKLSFSCPEKWEDMKPDGLGRFCTNCEKSVIDFRDKDAAYLKSILEKEGRVCGLFYPTQISPEKRNFKFSLKLLIASALLVFSCESIPDEVKLINELNPDKEPGIAEETTLLLGTIVEIMPSYKFGGEEGLQKFLKKNLRYPQNSVEGLVVVQFKISEAGKIKTPKIVKSLHPAADREVLRIVDLLQFEPASIAGKPFASSYTLPVRFKL